LNTTKKKVEKMQVFLGCRMHHDSWTFHWSNSVRGGVTNN